MISGALIGQLLYDAFWSGLAALGFAILFNVPLRALPGCLVCGALGHAARTLTMQLGLNIEFSTLIGAALVGFVSLGFAHRQQVPPAIYSVSGAIPMVPGVFAYSTMIGIINIAAADPATVGTELLMETVVNGVKTGLILVAIAGGISGPTLLFNRRKPVV
ncbi:MAG: threonine/serine exporter family protein [Anaerolineae bacterium]|nr:threonine/serine exporter family protein [Anaerolineae bacterium]